ncbi:hypothetical protein [Pontibacillus litoralis]|uniref:VCBS repeat-containing protein n=1 Tax=Pontibacillus litoralis JSM 072002 TaxID=1385512 RepID=A0A0A5HVD6_9BACI|nr:hypothetical protein [Pontibacillus litoralis]KGX87592.1 hypothetical protein N784_15200 [Pontibacillus litoralis JSM 072002]
MMKPIIQSFGLTFILFLLSGCTIAHTPAQLITPPALPKQDQQLWNAIQSDIPESAQLISPRGGLRDQTIFQEDLDLDGSDEAVIFYTEQSFSPYIHFAIYDYTEDDWNSMVHKQLEGYELDYFNFMPTDANKLSLVVGLAQGEGQTKQLHMYNMNQEGKKEIFSTHYSNILLDDLTQDGVTDMTIITLDRLNSAQAALYQWNDSKSVEKLSELSLDPYVNGYINAIAGKVSKNKRGIWLDAQVGAHSGTSYLLTYEEGHLLNVFEDLNHIQTTSPYPMESKDINGDGIIEMGYKIAPHGQEYAMVDTPWIDVYGQWDGDNGLIEVQRSYFQGEFIIVFPSLWPEDVTILEEDKSVTIHNQDQHTLMEIIWTPKERWEEKEQYEIVAKTTDYIYEMNRDYIQHKDHFKLWMETL